MSIRILQIVTYMGCGGLETMLMNYYRHINRDKVQFDFLVHRDFNADFNQEIKSLGGHIFCISRLIPWKKSYREQLKAFFKSHPEYRIVHVHQDCLSAVALQCASECGIPVRIVHSHNSNQDKNIKYLIKRHYMKQIPYYATEYFACGRAAGDWMFRGHPYQLLYNAVDVEKYVYSLEKAVHVRKKFHMENDLVIGHVGRFDPQKNHTFLIDIFFECTKLISNIKLLLVGDGERRLKIQTKVKALGMEDKVIFTGVRTDVDALLQAMDVFVFPSLYEGVPVTMIEAQAAGLPCVISNYVPNECIVTSGLVTIMSLADSPEMWAEHIIKMSHSQRKNHIREIQAADYDIVTAARKLEEFYLEKYGDNK